MKADLSRDTFDAAKHFRRVLEQQGRAAIDAEPNEQVAIDAALAEATAYDVIGPSGVPETLLPDGTPAGGFLLAANAAGTDVTISKGRMYVEGVLVQNDADSTFLTQPDAPLGGLSPGSLGLGGAGNYAAYLDVWERLIDTLVDPRLRETALGGPDGSLRAKTVWQLKWWALEQRDGPPSCATTGEPWRTTHGTLTASVGAPAIDPLPCILPPDTGFRRLENQLYRVEVHQAGAYGTLAFKWSRENGSVVAGVVEPAGVPATTPITGPTFSVTTVGRDGTLGFQKGDWVELCDDVAELIEGRGELLEVDSVDPANLTITTKTTPARAVMPANHPKLRRWDQRGAALAGGVIVPDGKPIALEDGVQITFDSGPFRAGDHWTIPARVALTPGGGSIEWPQDGSGTYLPQHPRGIVHHYASLAIFSYDGTTFTFLEDCRKPFPPLTALGAPPAAPMLSPCTLVLVPGTGWEQPLAKLFPDPKAAVDAELCFPAGEFPVTAPVVIATRGHVKVSGAGWGTHLNGPKVETVLKFTGCASVTIRDLTVAAGRVDGPLDATTKNINGALDCLDCADVVIERVAAHCGPGDGRGAACVTVRSTIVPGDPAIESGIGSLRIRSSRFVAGRMQYGILAVHQRRVTIEDNDLTVLGDAGFKLGDAVRTPVYLKALQQLLVGHADVTHPAAGAAAPADAGPARAPETLVKSRVLARNATVTVGGRSIAFRTPAAFSSVWQTYVDANAPKEFASNADVLRFVKAAAGTLLSDPKAREPFGEFRAISRYIQANATSVGARAISVGGQGFTDVRVLNNSIDGFRIGVGVGVSHREPQAGAPDRGGSVIVSGNQIRVAANVLSRGARHAVFVGNAQSVQITGNIARYDPGSMNPIPASDAIRVYGYFRKRLIVRDNHTIDFTNGVVVEALSAPGQYISERDDPTLEGRVGKVWLVHDNVCENATVVVDALACDHADNVK